MSLGSVFPYIQNKMESIGYTEHSDEFDLDNVASTILDKSFSIQLGEFSASVASQLDYEWSIPISLYVYLNGYQRPSDAMTDAINKASVAMDEIIDVGDRYTQTGIRNIKPTSLDFKKYAQDADHIIVIKIGLEATVHIYNNKNC
jgi:hypothetical protein